MKEKMKNFMASPKVTVGAFVVAIVLLMFSTVGGARAALTYYSENYATRVQMYNIGVSLLENGQKVSWRDYGQKSDGTWEENTGVLLENMLEEGESIKIGKKYAEELAISNSGTIGQYVRVSVYKYWLDKDGNKMQELSPDLIRLDLANTGDWLIDKDASTQERTVLYYRKALNAGETSPVFASGLTIDDMIATKVTQTEEKKDGYTTIRTEYDYDGVTFCVEAKVDAVQEHNAEDAIWSAWGRKVSVKNGTLSLR